MGSGYTAALAGRLAADVFAVERFDKLTDHARQRIVKLGLDNLAVRHGDGMLGWPERGPYDRILITGQVEDIPQILFGQLRPGGSVIAPMRHERRQQIARVAADGTREWFGLSHELPPLKAGRSQAL